MYRSCNKQQYFSSLGDSLCAEWEAEKGGRMGCLMKEKIQGLAERKAFILLFLIVWELCSSSGNLTYREIIARPAFLVNLHTAMVCMFPPPFFKSF
jgi:hypothetical protein